MSNFQVDVEKSQVDELFNKLDDDDLRRQIMLEGLKGGARVLTERTKELFKTRMGEAATHYSRYIKKPFYEGVRMTVDKAYNETIVSIMSDFRMRFFERGTKDRTTKKGYGRGHLTAKHFFRDARNSSENEIYDAMNKDINKAFTKYIG